MRQRLGVAAALLRDPRLLLLDEPATGLDPAGMRDMRALVARLSLSGTTVLLSSHLLTEVEELCNRVAIVRTGLVVFEGALDDLKRTAGGEWRLRTTDDARAVGILRGQRGIDGVREDPLELRFEATEEAAAELSVALVEGGVAIRALAPHSATLEDLFFRLTEGDAAASGPGADRGPGPHRPRAGGLMVALRTVYRWELRKLVAQKRTYLGLGAAVAVPIIFVVALALQSGQPDDVAFGRYVRQSGLAVPPVILIFGSYWLFPLITALVAGDIVAAEDHNGTLKTILTRSVGRGRIFAAKVLAAHDLRRSSRSSPWGSRR